MSSSSRLVIIDTPPHADVTATRAMEVADLLLIPCRPSAFDLAAIKTTARLVQLLGKPAYIVFTAGPSNAPRISLQALMAEAFDDVLRKYGESPVGD